VPQERLFAPTRDGLARPGPRIMPPANEIATESLEKPRKNFPPQLLRSALPSLSDEKTGSTHSPEKQTKGSLCKQSFQ
jgi:hypothetical protein